MLWEYYNMMSHIGRYALVRCPALRKRIRRISKSISVLLRGLKMFHFPQIIRFTKYNPSKRHCFYIVFLYVFDVLHIVRNLLALDIRIIYFLDLLCSMFDANTYSISSNIKSSLNGYKYEHFMCAGWLSEIWARRIF